MRVQAEKVALTLLEHLEDQRATAVVFVIVLAVGLPGIQVLGSYFYAKTLAPMGPSPEPEFADGEEKKAHNARRRFRKEVRVAEKAVAAEKAAAAAKAAKGE